MIDSTDTQTQDIFPLPKKLGRPVTGKAKTSAQRQADYRSKKRMYGGIDSSGHRVINRWVQSEAFFALERLSNHLGLTQSQLLEQLLIRAQDEYLKTIDIDTPEWDKYFN